MEQEIEARQYRNYRYRIILSKSVEKRIENHFRASQNLFNYLRTENLAYLKTHNEDLPLKELIRLSFEKTKTMVGINRSLSFPTAHRLFIANESARRHGKPCVKEKTVGDCEASFTINFFRKEINNDGRHRAKVALGGIGEITLVYHRPIPPGAVCRQLTIRRNASRQYFALIGLYLPPSSLPHNPVKTALGIDFSVPKLYVSSDKDVGPDLAKIHQYEVAEPNLIKAQAKLSRMKVGGKNYEKQRLKLARIHQKIENRRRDFLHKETKRLADSFDFIGVETLSLKEIEQRQNLARHIHDDSWARFLFLLRYKMKQANKVLRYVPTYYPSSKTCHRCGYIKRDLQLSERVFVCPNCHASCDRDYNAAKNIRDKALRDAGFRINYIRIAASN